MTDWDKKVPIVLSILYPDDWLDSLAEGDAAGRTNRVVQTEVRRARNYLV